MTYTSLFEPLLIISLAVCLGILIGAIGLMFCTAKEIKTINKELDKFRGLYFNELDCFKDKYEDKDPTNELEP